MILIKKQYKPLNNNDGLYLLIYYFVVRLIYNITKLK